MDVVVVGGGVGGLAGALALARTGHRVTVLERDVLADASSPDDAFAATARRGAPQVRHSHAFLARLRNLLRDRAPDLLAALLDAGASELRFADALPETLVDRSARPGDDELVALACRRTTFEWVLRRAAAAEPGVSIHDGVVVTGLVAEESTVRVRGVRGDGPDGPATWRGDLVVDASGPRSPADRWLRAIGVELPPDEVHQCGIVYLSRFYRLRRGATPPEVRGPVAVDLGYLKFAVFPGDGDAFSVTLAVDAGDSVLRRVTEPDRFDAVARALPPVAPWLDGRADPETDVFVMGGLRNRRRRFTRDGEPLVDGFVAVGDAAVCTNPLYGRGCSLATVHAFALADAVAQHPDDARDLARAFGAATEELLAPWFTNAVLQDAQSRAMAAASADPSAVPDGGADGAAGSAPATVDPDAFLRDVVREGLLPAVRTDPVVFRAFLRWFNLLAAPDVLLSDPDVVARVMAAYQARDDRPPEPPIGPDRAALLASVGAG